MLKTHSVRVNIQHDELAHVWVSSPEAALAQARLYMRCFAPLGVWKNDTMPDLNLSGACIKDARGMYLYDVSVYPQLDKPLTK